MFSCEIPDVIIPCVQFSASISSAFWAQTHFWENSEYSQSAWAQLSHHSLPARCFCYAASQLHHISSHPVTIFTINPISILAQSLVRQTNFIILFSFPWRDTLNLMSVSCHAEKKLRRKQPECDNVSFRWRRDVHGEEKQVWGVKTPVTLAVYKLYVSQPLPIKMDKMKAHQKWSQDILVNSWCWAVVLAINPWNRIPFLLYKDSWSN